MAAIELHRNNALSLSRGVCHQAGVERMKKVRTLDGLPVVDAIKPLMVEITDTDIRAASKKGGDFCAAALALCRDDKIEDAFVHLSVTYVRYHNRWVRFRTTA